MGIQIEFNPDLALRAYGTPEREVAECVPSELKKGTAYPFLKKDQRNYWLLGEIPLVITQGKGNLSRPIASVRIRAATHTLRNGEVWTQGMYEVVEVFDPESKEVHFESYARR